MIFFAVCVQKIWISFHFRNIQSDGDGGLCDMGDVVVMEKESSMYPYLSLSLTKGIKLAFYYCVFNNDQKKSHFKNFNLHVHVHVH